MLKEFLEDVIKEASVLAESWECTGEFKEKAKTNENLLLWWTIGSGNNSNAEYLFENKSFQWSYFDIYFAIKRSISVNEITVNQRFRCVFSQTIYEKWYELIEVLQELYIYIYLFSRIINQFYTSSLRNLINKNIYCKICPSF